MTPERLLWQAVIYRAVTDALAEGDAPDVCKERRDADAWLRRGGRDFRQVCNLAGMDPDFIREAYVEGRIDRELLRKAAA